MLNALKVAYNFVIDIVGIFYGFVVSLMGILLRDPEFLKETD